MGNPFTRIPTDLTKLDRYLHEHESSYNLKEGTDAQIIWHTGEPHQTDFSIVYLHGFRASHPEGNPVHRHLAREWGCNLFLSRMKEHGIKTKYPLLNLTVEKMLQSARFAINIGKQIGEKVIIMGTSTGASLALFLAAHPSFKKNIDSLILYSPLIDFYGFTPKLLSNRIGRKILGIIPGNKYLIKSPNTTYAEDRIWNKEYAMGGALALGEFVERYMKPDLIKQVTQPAFVGYYYKNKHDQDMVVSVQAIKKMTQHLGTRTEQLYVSNFPDAKNHVICSSLVSKSVDNVIDNTNKFLKSVAAHRATEK